MSKDTTETEGKKDGSLNLVQFNEGEIKAHVDQVVRQTVEETLNMMLDEEADRLCQAQRYERTPDRADTRAGHYSRQLQIRAGQVK